MHYLGIDLGNSFIKGAVLDLDALTVGDVQSADFPLPLVQFGLPFRQFEPASIVAATRRILERLLSHAPDAQGIVVCGRAASIIFATDEGCAVSKVIDFLDLQLPAFPDLRGKCCGRAGRLPLDESVSGSRRQGNSNLPLNLLLWLKRNNLMPRRSYITTLASYVVANLCGCTPTLEVTDACALGALNLQASGWDHAVISELNLDCLLWPEIAEPGVRAGEIRIGLRRLPVFASLGRHQCSQVGVFLEKEELSVNLSEWPCISQIAAVPEEGAFEVQPFFDGQFLRTSYNLPSCGIFRTLNNLLKAGEPERCRQNGSETRGHHQKTGGPLPVFENGFARSKRNFIGNGDHDATTNAFSGALLLDCLAGSFYGVISDEVASCARRLTPEGGWKQVVFSGKPVCTSAAFRQKLCDRLGREHTLAPSEENSLLGLLVICLAYTGLTHSVSDALATARTEFRTEEPASHF